MSGNYSKKFISCAVLVLSIVFCHRASAQIPVTDGVSIATQVANQVESITKWTQQFSQLQQQIQQYRDQFQAITGSRGMGALLDNTGLKAALPQDWQNVLTDIKTTAKFVEARGAFPLATGLPKAGALYDIMASHNAVMDDLYTKSNKQLDLIKLLGNRIDSATDPAAKADLANRIAIEQNSIQANQNLVTILQAKQKQELQQASAAATKEYLCKEFKRSTC